MSRRTGKRKTNLNESQQQCCVGDSMVERYKFFSIEKIYCAGIKALFADNADMWIMRMRSDSLGA